MKKIDTSKYRIIRNHGHCLQVPYRNRNSIEAIKFLDNHADLIRRDTWSLTWLNKNKAKIVVKDSYKNRPLLIVGKGPSLDNLSEKRIPKDCVVFFCNDAYIDLPNHETFGVQMDRSCGKVLERLPKRIVSPNTLDLYSNIEGTYIMTPKMCGVARIRLVSILSIQVAKYMGFSPIIMTAFDGAFGGACEYAKKIGYSAKRGGAIKRFHGHGAELLPLLEGANWKHIPIASTDHLSTFSDNIQQLQCNPLTLSEHWDSEHQVDCISTEDSVLDKDTSHFENQHDHSNNLQYKLCL